MLGDSLPDYELFIYSLQDRYPIIETTTLAVVRQASDVATIEGDLVFRKGLRLRVMEVVRFDLDPPRISRYGYEVWRGNEKLYWYDSQPHPNDPALAGAAHHKHIPPDIKHHRVPAPHMTFTGPNIPGLIAEIEQLIAALEQSEPENETPGSQNRLP
jgi:Family of unknown function (DUF6516)